MNAPAELETIGNRLQIFLLFTPDIWNAQTIPIALYELKMAGMKNARENALVLLEIELSVSLRLSYETRFHQISAIPPRWGPSNHTSDRTVSNLRPSIQLISGLI